MQSFFVSRPRPEPHPNVASSSADSQCDRQWAIRVIKKASLKVQDIHLKLDLSKVVQLLQFCPKIERTRSHLITFCPSVVSDSQSQLDYSNASNQRREVLNNDHSQLGFNMSQSVLSQEFSSSFLTSAPPGQNKHVSESRLITQQTSIVEPKENKEFVSDRLRWKNVVTKNVLDDYNSETFKKLHLDLENVSQENIILRECLNSIIQKLKEKELLDIEGDIEQLSTDEIKECCQMVSKKEIIDKIADFDSMMREFQQTIKVCEQLKKQLERKIDECSQFESILSEKEQGITSLQLVQRNLQNRIATLTSKSSQDPPPQKLKKTAKWLLCDKDLGQTVQQ